MKKFLIFIPAFLLAASTTVLIAQNPKVNKQVKKSTTAVKDEAQKPMVKDESKTIELEGKTRHPQTAKTTPPNPGDHKNIKKSAKVEKRFEKHVDPVHNPANKVKEPNPGSKERK